MNKNSLVRDPRVTPDVRAEINWRAYMKFINSGGVHGNDLNHWFQAEQEVVWEHAQTNGE